MSAGKKWAAAGSAAAVLAGGLALGAPAAVAAPGDAACLQASSRLEAALSATGITAESLGSLEPSADAVAAAEAQYAALVGTAGGPSLQELQVAGAALAAAQESGDPQAVAAAQARVAELDAALSAALGGLDPAAAEQAAVDAAAVFDALLAGLGLDEAAVGELLVLLQQAGLACQAGEGQPPALAPAVPAAPVAPVTPVQGEPLAVAPAEPGTVAVNPGTNIQTAAPQEDRPATGLLAALAAAGIAVAAAAAVRTHRLRH